MTPSTTFRTLVDRLQMAQEDVSAISGRNTRSVRSWLSGAIPPPASLMLVLMALDEERIDFKWVADKLKKKGGGR